MNKNEGLYIQDLYYDSTSAPYGCLALPWWIREKKPVYWPRHNCLLEPLICGERVFSKLKDDIENAKHSVNIITWGFDPGMHLVRGKYGDGVKYGDLLKSVATRKPPVKVNLLVWHDDLLSQSKMKNIPGYYGAGHPAVGCYQKKEFYYQEHQEYNAQWFDDVNRNRSGEIEFRYRFVSFEFLKPSLAGEGMPIDIMKIASASYATHHQKMVLIDYEDPPNAIGYVMGHNSITDFWDTEEHIFQDVRRERFFNQEASKIVQEALKRESTARLREGNFSSASSPSMEKSSAFAKYINDHSYVAKPYQDVSCRVRGPILSDMNHNFCEAWMEGSRPGAMFFELLGVTMRPVINTATRRALGKATYYKDKEDWIENRKVLTWKSFVSPQWTHSAQLLRTQPEQGEKSIKECYANMARQMQHYIFIQNQYIQYETWADYLIVCVERLRKNGFAKPVYVFIVTSTPEDTGMDIPTYGVISKLGNYEAMAFEYNEVLKRVRKGMKDVSLTLEKMSEYKINVLVGSMWTCDKTKSDRRLQEKEYEEIYIHSKVAVVDDAAFTIGSANLNLRSMAIDSELNVFSNASDVAYNLRCDLFHQCSGMRGPDQFSSMTDTYNDWMTLMDDNFGRKKEGMILKGFLLPFRVDRQPTEPVV